MNDLVNAVTGIVRSPALIALCLGAGLYFSLRSCFLQLRHLREMVHADYWDKRAADRRLNVVGDTDAVMAGK